jgi:hypothetical protein
MAMRVTSLLFAPDLAEAEEIPRPPGAPVMARDLYSRPTLAATLPFHLSGFLIEYCCEAASNDSKAARSL